MVLPTLGFSEGMICSNQRCTIYQHYNFSCFPSNLVCCLIPLMFTHSLNWAIDFCSSFKVRTDFSLSDECCYCFFIYSIYWLLKKITECTGFHFIVSEWKGWIQIQFSHFYLLNYLKTIILIFFLMNDIKALGCNVKEKCEKKFKN